MKDESPIADPLKSYKDLCTYADSKLEAGLIQRYGKIYCYRLYGSNLREWPCLGATLAEAKNWIDEQVKKN